MRELRMRIKIKKKIKQVKKFTIVKEFLFENYVYIIWSVYGIILTLKYHFTYET